MKTDKKLLAIGNRASLRSLFTTRKGKKPEILSGNMRDETIPYIDIEAFETGNLRRFADKNSSQIVSKGELLVVWDGARSGLVGKSPEEGALGSTLAVLRPKEGVKIVSDYALYFLRGQYKTINRNPRGTGIPHVNPEIFWNLELPVSSPEIQLQVVKQLDEIFPCVQQAQRKIELAKIALRRFRQSVLQSAFRGELTADWKGKTAVQQKDWAPKKLSTIFTIRTGGTPSRKNKNYYKNGTISWIKTGEVQNNQIFESQEKITELAVEESNAKVFPAGTLLVAMYGEGKTRGQVGWLQINAATNQACAALINEDLIDETRQFVFYFLLSQYEQLRAMAVGGNQPNLNLGIIKSWEMPLPSIDEQKEVVRKVQSYFEIADRVEKKLIEVEGNCDRISSSILVSAFADKKYK